MLVANLGVLGWVRSLRTLPNANEISQSHHRYLTQMFLVFWRDFTKRIFFSQFRIDRKFRSTLRSLRRGCGFRIEVRMTVFIHFVL